MRSPGTSLSRVAFGFQLHLWQESDVKWSATIHDGEREVCARFEEETLFLLHILAQARNRALVRWKDQEFPREDTLLDSWAASTSER